MNADSVAGDDFERADFESVFDELLGLRNEMLESAAAAAERLDGVHKNYRDSARNLLHYLALRRRDLRSLQVRLSSLGLSSLGRAEAHVQATVDAVLEVLRRAIGRDRSPPASDERVVTFADGRRMLQEHSAALLGPAPHDRGVRIMVTMPGEAADDYTLVHDLVQHGMDCVRINCAHDDATVWGRIIEHLRRAEHALGRRCRVVMDLAGPKLRTGPIETGPQVVKVRPQRDDYGRVVAPARVWLTPDSAPGSSPSPADACVPVSPEWLARLRLDDEVKFTDARGSKRVLRIVDVTPRGAWAECEKTAYLATGTTLRRADDASKREGRDAPVGELPAIEGVLTLRVGDQLIVTRDQQPGRAATHDASGRILTPATVGCTLPEVFDDVRSGEAIWFDDGKIGGVVEKIEPTHALVRVTHARPKGEKLKADKGINLVESRLRLPALSEQDVRDLDFVAAHADVVELSFANSVEDVESLQAELSKRGPRRPAVVLKIETRRGFENLPEMLLTAMRSPCCGVMIARGDLAVECGFERMAEVQEEILWICEAAHVPVIWATQVLESLAKDGLPSRAEITDAAMGHRAECVMLNKGPHILLAVRALDDILRRMQAHQAKKQAMLRELRLAHSLSDEADSASSSSSDEARTT